MVKRLCLIMLILFIYSTAFAKVEARFFILTDDCFISDAGINRIKIRSSKGKKKIKVEKDKEGKDIYRDMPELTTVEAMRALAAVKGETIVDVDPLLALFGTYDVVGKFNNSGTDYTIVKAAIPMKVISDIKKALFVEDALTLDTLTALGIAYIYGGREYSWEPNLGLYWIIQQRFGLDLSGTYDTGQKDESGNSVMMPYLRQITIAGE